jgi:hypothetical protein
MILLDRQPQRSFISPGSDPEELKRSRGSIVGRLAPGFTPEQAQAELALLTERQAQADPDFAGFTPNVQSLTSEYTTASASSSRCSGPPRWCC